MHILFVSMPESAVHVPHFICTVYVMQLMSWLTTSPTSGLCDVVSVPFCFVSVASIESLWDMGILVQPQRLSFFACAKSVGHSKLNKWSDMTAMHCRLLLSSIYEM